MPDPRHEHGSGVSAVGDYVPGGRMLNPSGLSGVSPVVAERIPPPARERKAETKRRMREATAEPPKRGRPIGSKNRPPIPPEMFDAPPDQG